MGSLPDSKYIIQTDGYWFVEAHDVDPNKGYISLSAKGIINGLSDQPNDGADFGPDTYDSSYSGSGIPYTQTSGIQEAIRYAYVQASTKEDTVLIKSLFGNNYILNSVPSFPAVNGINGSFGRGTGFIPVYPNVAIDFNGSVLNINYAGSVFQQLSGNDGLYHGYIKNVHMVGSAAGQDYMIQTSTSDFREVVTNVTIDGASNNVQYGIFVAGSNSVTRNIKFINVLKGYYIDNGSGGTGCFIYNPYYSNTQGLSGASLIYVESTSDTIYVIGGRSIGVEYLFNIQSSLSDLRVIGHDSDASSDVLYINAGSGTVNDVAMIGCGFIDPSGVYANLDAGTGSINGVILADNRMQGAPSANGYIKYAGTITNLILKNNTGLPATPTLSTNPPASATAYQNTNPYDILIYLPSYATTSGTAGSVAVAIGTTSSPSTTFTQFVSGSTTSSAPDTIQIKVPAGWYYEVTTSGVTLATATVVAA